MRNTAIAQVKTKAFYVVVVGMGIVCLLIGLLAGGGGISAEELQSKLVQARHDTCEDTNQRRKNTIATLDTLLDQAAEQDPASATQIRQSRDFTVLLIRALAPRRNCDAYAAELTK